MFNSKMPSYNLYTRNKFEAFFIKAILCCAMLVMLSGCDQPVEPVKLHGSTMGTSYSVIIYPKTVESPSTIGILQSDIDSRLIQINKLASTYDSSSELSQLNQQIKSHNFDQSRLTVRVAPELHRLLEEATAIYKQSEGYFDITVGALVNAWGFGPTQATINDKPSTSPEAQLVIQQLLANSGQSAISFEDDDTITLSHPVYLDLSALAKGWGVDEVADLVRQRGFDRYLIEIGGEIRVGDNKPQGPWRIAIEKPSVDAEQAPVPLNVIDAANISVATSGDYRNYREIDGRRYSHTIDPKTGRPVAHSLASVTVLHPRAMFADAWATALNAMGSKSGIQLANQLGLAAVFVIHDTSGFKIEYSDNYVAQYAITGDNR